jgi:hypothetical protein
MPWQICLNQLILLAILNWMAKKSGSSLPMAKNAKFPNVFAGFLCDDCENKPHATHGAKWMGLWRRHLGINGWF